jgi:hypothetical protein
MPVVERELITRKWLETYCFKIVSTSENNYNSLCLCGVKEIQIAI